MANNLPQNTSYPESGGPDISSLMGAIKGAKNYYDKPLAYPSQPTATPPEEMQTYQAPINKPVQPSIKQDIPIPSDYSGFWGTDTSSTTDKPRWVAPTESAVIRSAPTGVDLKTGEPISGGQYVYDPKQPGELIKSNRSSSKDLRKQIIGGIPGFIEIDHEIPLWAGGADLQSNMVTLSNIDHDKKTRIQAVPLTLLSAGEIDLPEAKMLALSWRNRDASNIPPTTVEGYLPDVSVAKQILERWREDEKLPPSGFAGHSFGDTVRSTLDEIPEVLQKGSFLPFAGEAPSAGKEIAKGISTGLSGIAPYIPQAGASKEATMAGYAANFIGNIVNMIAGVGLIERGLSKVAATEFFGNLLKTTKLTKPIAAADSYMAKKIPGIMSQVAKLPVSVATLEETGKELTQKLATGNLARMAIAGGIYGKVANPYQQWYQEIDDKTLAGEAGTFLADAATMAAFGMAPRGAVGALMNAGAAWTLATMKNKGEDPGGAILEAATMAVLHGMGSKKVENLMSKVKLPQLPGGLTYGIGPVDTRNELIKAREMQANAEKRFKGELTNTSHELLNEVSPKIVAKPAKNAKELDERLKRIYTEEEIVKISNDIEREAGKALAQPNPDYQAIADLKRARYEALTNLSFNGHPETEFYKALRDEVMTKKFMTSLEQTLDTNVQMAQGGKVPTDIVKTFESFKTDPAPSRDRVGEFKDGADLIARQKSKQKTGEDIYLEGFTASAGNINPEAVKSFEKAAREGNVLGQSPDKKDIPVWAVNLTDDLKGVMTPIIENQRLEAIRQGVPGTRDVPHENEIVGLYGGIKDPKTGKVDVVHLGYLATDWRLNNKNTGFNNNLPKHKAFEKYTLNQKGVAEAMNDKGFKVIQMWVEPQYKDTLTTKGDYAHMKLKLTEQSWKTGEKKNVELKTEKVAKAVRNAAIKARNRREALSKAKAKTVRETVVAAKPEDVKVTAPVAGTKTPEKKQPTLPGIEAPVKKNVTERDKIIAKNPQAKAILENIKKPSESVSAENIVPKETPVAVAKKEIKYPEKVVKGSPETKAKYYKIGETARKTKLESEVKAYEEKAVQRRASELERNMDRERTVTADDTRTESLKEDIASHYGEKRGPLAKEEVADLKDKGYTDEAIKKINEVVSWKPKNTLEKAKDLGIATRKGEDGKEYIDFNRDGSLRWAEGKSKFMKGKDGEEFTVTPEDFLSYNLRGQLALKEFEAQRASSIKDVGSFVTSIKNMGGKNKEYSSTLGDLLSGGLDKLSQSIVKTNLKAKYPDASDEAIAKMMSKMGGLKAESNFNLNSLFKSKFDTNKMEETNPFLKKLFGQVNREGLSKDQPLSVLKARAEGRDPRAAGEEIKKMRKAEQENADLASAPKTKDSVSLDTQREDKEMDLTDLEINLPNLFFKERFSDEPLGKEDAVVDATHLLKNITTYVKTALKAKKGTAGEYFKAEDVIKNLAKKKGIEMKERTFTKAPDEVQPSRPLTYEEANPTKSEQISEEISNMFRDLENRTDLDAGLD